MAFPKLSDSEIQELMRIAESGKDSDEAPVQPISHVEQWIIANDVKAGDTPVSAIQLWYHYVDWCKGHRTTTQNTFYKTIRTIFADRYNNTRDRRYYLLDPTPFDMTKEGQLNINFRLRAEREARKANAKKV